MAVELSTLDPCTRDGGPVAASLTHPGMPGAQGIRLISTTRTPTGQPPSGTDFAVSKQEKNAILAIRACASVRISAKNSTYAIASTSASHIAVSQSRTAALAAHYRLPYIIVLKEAHRPQRSVAASPQRHRHGNPERTASPHPLVLLHGQVDRQCDSCSAATSHPPCAC